jgi:hypothetical protein
VAVFIEIFRSSNPSDKNKSIYEKTLKKIKVLRTSIFFVVLTLIFFVTNLVYDFQVTIRDLAHLQQCAVNWTKCLFINFDFNHPQKCRDICGNLPVFSTDFNFTSWVILVASGQSILVAGTG